MLIFELLKRQIECKGIAGPGEVEGGMREMVEGLREKRKKRRNGEVSLARFQQTNGKT